MTARKIDIKDIIATYSKDKMVFERRNKAWFYYTGRLPSFYLTWIFLRLNISANQATYISLIVGLASCIFLALGSYMLKLAGALMVNLGFVLDCVDGNIARYRKSFSPFGEFIDALVGYIVTAFLFMSIGVGAFIDPGSSALLRHAEIFPLFSKDVFLFAGFWSSLSYVLVRLGSLRYKTIFTSVPNDDNTKVIASNRFHRIISIISRNMFGTSGFFMPLLLFAIVFRLLGLLVLLYAVVNTSGLILIIIKATAQSFRTLKKEN